MPPERGQDHAVHRKEVRSLDLAAKNRHLMSKSQEFALTFGHRHRGDEPDANDQADQPIDGGEEHERGP